MSNAIRSYGYTSSYSRLTQRGDVQAKSQQPAEATQQAAKPPTAAGTAQPTGPSGLEPAEREMIGRYFPESPSMSMRLYGPNSQSRTVNPGALGTRLDLQG